MKVVGILIIVASVVAPVIFTNTEKGKSLTKEQLNTLRILVMIGGLSGAAVFALSSNK